VAAQTDRILVLASAFGDLDEPRVEAEVENLLHGGMRPREIQKILELGMRIVAESYRIGEYFLADRLYAGRLYRRIMEMPRMSSVLPGAVPLGTVLVGALPGEFHDEGNDALAAALRSLGLQAVDLGLGAGAEELEAALVELKPGAAVFSCWRSDAAATTATLIRRLHAAFPGLGGLALRGGEALASTFSRLGADAYVEDILAAQDFCLARAKGAAS